MGRGLCLGRVWYALVKDREMLLITKNICNDNH